MSAHADPVARYPRTRAEYPAERLLARQDGLRRFARLAAICLSTVSMGLVPASAPAQPSANGTQVTEKDLERARRQQPVITEADMERARKAHPMLTESELARMPVQAAPNIDALPAPAAKRPIDLGALAKGYQDAISASLPPSGAKVGPGLLIFISFSMPEKTLTRLVDQAARAQGTLVLRGFVNGSLKETVFKVQRLLGDRKAAFQIDPQAFDRFSVAATPTFVLVRDGAVPTDCSAGTCFARDAFVSVAGDVSLGYALEHLRSSAPSFAKEAAKFLARVEADR